MKRRFQTRAVTWGAVGGPCNAIHSTKAYLAFRVRVLLTLLLDRDQCVQHKYGEADSKAVELSAARGGRVGASGRVGMRMYAMSVCGKLFRPECD